MPPKQEGGKKKEESKKDPRKESSVSPSVSPTRESKKEEGKKKEESKKDPRKDSSVSPSVSPTRELKQGGGKKKQSKKDSKKESSDSPTREHATEEDDADLRAAADRAVALKTAAEEREREEELLAAPVEGQSTEAAADAAAAIEDETKVAAPPGTAGQVTVYYTDLKVPVLGFQASPPPARRKPTIEEMGHPYAAQEMAQTRRIKETELANRLLEPHPGGRIWARDGTGTTPFSHRMHHQSISTFTETSEHYNAIPAIQDFAIQALNPSLQRANPMVFLELVTATATIGKLVFELFEHQVPRTAHNFMALCCGDPLKGELSYVDCRFHRIIPGFMMVSGDISNSDGTGGKSIYGDTFPDESFQLSHVGPGILTMVNNGPDTNSSQFAILFTRNLTSFFRFFCLFSSCLSLSSVL